MSSKPGTAIVGVGGGGLAGALALPYCESTALSWTQSTGSGTIYSYGTIMRGPTPVWTTIVPYAVGSVQMDDGYTLFAQIDGEPDAIAIGNPVTTRLVQRGEQKLPVFTMTDHQ